ncbi:MAG: hypothetical protein RQ745_01430 [Longimicrobiales bacterium]|nr:hypothetical protein [Longimicrobiales bacterium]
MSGGILVGLAGVVAFGAALRLYHTRELPVPGRSLLATLRGGTLVLVLLLAWNPDLPPGERPDGGRVVILDTSGSMLASSGDPLREAEAWIAGLEARVDRVPGALADATARAVEGGAGRVTVVTDLRSGDGVAIRAIASTSSIPIDVVDVGGEVDNAGISELVIPALARSGEEVRVGARVHAQGRSGIELALLLDGDTVARASDLPAPVGTERTVDLAFVLPEAPSGAPGRHLLEATLLSPDDLPGDDRRLGVLLLEEEAGGIVAVSWAPDWEFRSLLPLLDEVSGLTARGYLSLGDAGWLRTGAEPGVVDGEAVREALTRADLVIMHAAPASDTGLVALAGSLPRRLELAPGGRRPEVNRPQPGEWFVAADLPPSPIAADLAGIELLGLPPLTRLRRGGEGALTPLLVQRGGSGVPLPAFEMARGEGERVVTARAEGFWRWSGREGAPGELYRRLWSGLTAWLLTPDAVTRTTGFGPRPAEVAPGEPIEVLGGSAVGTDLEIGWNDAVTGEARRTDTLRIGPDGRGIVPGFDDRGALAWRARVLEGEAARSEGEPTAGGVLIVQPPGTELRAPRDTALVADIARTERVTREALGSGVPLRDSPLPWILLILLLSAEWIGRRRVGLR